MQPTTARGPGSADQRLSVRDAGVLTYLLRPDAYKSQDLLPTQAAHDARLI